MKTDFLMRRPLIVSLMLLLTGAYSFAAERVLHSFNIEPLGANPEAALIADSAATSTAQPPLAEVLVPYLS